MDLQTLFFLITVPSWVLMSEEVKAKHPKITYADLYQVIIVCFRTSPSVSGFDFFREKENYVLVDIQFIGTLI